MDSTGGSAVASSSGMEVKLSGFVMDRNDTVLHTFGPHGETFLDLLDERCRLDPASPRMPSTFIDTVDAFRLTGDDRATHWCDLGALHLGRQTLLLQRFQPVAGDAQQIMVSIETPVRLSDTDALPLALLLDRVPAVAFVLDADDRFVYVNNRTEHLLDRSSGDLLGRRPKELFASGDVRIDILLSGNEAARSRGYHLVEISATEIGLSIVRLHKSALIIDGRQGVAALGMDPADSAATRSRSSDREVQLGRLVDLMPAPIWVISRARRIIRLNDAARRLATSTTSHLIGALVDTAYPKTARAVFGPPEDAFDTLATAEHPAPIFTSVDRDRVFRIDRTMLPGPGGSASAMAVMLTDLSEVHGVQQELQMKNEVLEHRNAELDQFAHMASHDLRAPLRAIYAFTQMAMEEEGDEHRDHLGAILGSVDRMRSVLDSLLDYATANANPVFEQASLSDVVGSVLGDLASDIADSGATVKVGELPTLQCDVTAMRRLFQNLIANAITYAGDNPPSITITSTPEYRFVEIVVTDRGIGFAQQQENDVFRPFKRLSAESKGQGIGLSMCRRIVESHHGTIRAISQSGGPTSMVIRLPRRRTP